MEQKVEETAVNSKEKMARYEGGEKNKEEGAVKMFWSNKKEEGDARRR